MIDTQVFDAIRNVVNYIAIIIPLAFTTGNQSDTFQGKASHFTRRTILRAIASLAAYIAIDLLLIVIKGSYYLYVLNIFVCGLWFVLGGASGDRRLRFMQLATTASSVILANGLLSFALATNDNGTIVSGRTVLLFSVLMLLANTAQAGFLIRFSPRTTASVPSRYWMTITALPLFYFAFLQLQLFASVSGGDETGIRSLWSVASQLLTLVAILVTYYSAYLITTAYFRAEEERFMSQRLQLELSHVERSAHMVSQVRKDKHEIKNLFFYLKIMLDSGAYDELKEYVNDKIDKTYSLLEEFDSGNKMLDYLFSQKVSEARRLGIKIAVNLDISPNLPISDRDLYGVVANLLDNAIEATQLISQDKRDIQVAINTCGGYLIVKIKNAVKGNVLLDNPSLKTTKRDKSNHGIGLKIVRSIALRNQGSLSTTMEHGYFVATVILSTQGHSQVPAQ
ncbi:MAG: GHKL domain-containing protein [Olsenella sp.]|jgi:signal transduction histidine kinase|nr:GHKL domain-containing protein [Olsenella sp.]MCI1810608.1 GHKL domain-containing protein [Olsenella sp.]MCI1879309.1 GHKL domain-containing protein [Olsenella sp.]